MCLFPSRKVNSPPLKAWSLDKTPLKSHIRLNNKKTNTVLGFNPDQISAGKQQNMTKSTNISIKVGTAEYPGQKLPAIHQKLIQHRPYLSTVNKCCVILLDWSFPLINEAGAVELMQRQRLSAQIIQVKLDAS